MCIEMYTCTCPDARQGQLCKHVHKVHALHGGKNLLSYKCVDVSWLDALKSSYGNVAGQNDDVEEVTSEEEDAPRAMQLRPRNRVAVVDLDEGPFLVSICMHLVTHHSCAALFNADNVTDEVEIEEVSSEEEVDAPRMQPMDNQVAVVDLGGGPFIVSTCMLFS